MRWIAVFVVVLGVALVAMAGYVRLAPSDADRWHRFVTPGPPGDSPTQGGFTARRVVEGDPQTVMTTLDAVAQDTPRTRVLAGSAEDGFVTYVTRSAFWGFPDYTTVYLTRNDPQAGGATTLTIHARLRFGQSDMGVNGARVRGWMDALPAGVLQSPAE
ncbi:DUF1499 domain-containing protein [Salibaculum sp.]|uniref:DUF1499 domain-containing protein n=1 Tax=Salibaculum sp. TaxID=2855480 RepID=UPI002B46D718|nr:DUF1499 domain-containing protein [Salibaculum sp.]HKL70476.1 DUF1499 domain-containing protein [Salibaculum sp.]